MSSFLNILIINRLLRRKSKYINYICRMYIPCSFYSSPFLKPIIENEKDDLDGFEIL